MTAALADFIASPAGEMYGTYCARYSKDPGAIFADDATAFAVGVAYMWREHFEAAPEPDPLSYWEGQLR